jgi:hypothetical protein
VPLTNSFNSLAQSNEQPEYQCLWEPIAFNPSSVATVTPFPTAAGGGYMVPGSALMFGLTGTQAGVGSYPPLGPNTSYPGGDAAGSGATGNTTFPFNWTVQYVDIASTSTTVSNGLAGVNLGVGSLGAFASPQNLTTPANTSIGTGQPVQVVMVGKRGIAQLLVDNTTTVGHTIKVSTSHTGQFSDNGNTTWTAGTTVGIALQAVTISTGPLLCWCSVNFPV